MIAIKLEYKIISNYWVVPPPSNSHHQVITFLVGDRYKPSFATVTGRGDNPKYLHSVSLVGTR